MKGLGIFAKTFAGDQPDTVLGAVAAAGFNTAHFNMACCGLPAMPDAIASETTAAIAKASKAAGVTLAGLSGTWNMIHPDPAVRAAGMRRLEVLAKACAPMAVKLITLCTGTRDPDDQWRSHADNSSPAAWRDLREAMETAVAIAERHGIDLGVEPELANVVCNAGKARQLLDEIGSARIKIVLDPANLFEVGTAARRLDVVQAAVDLLGDRVAMAHAKDRDASGAFVAAGHGVIDFQHFFDALRRSGFSGPVITHGLTAQEAPGVAKFLSAAAVAVGWR